MSLHFQKQLSEKNSAEMKEEIWDECEFLFLFLFFLN